jgi:hypothetical protein
VRPTSAPRNSRPLAIVAAVGWLVAAPAVRAERSVDYVYVDANEGGSSGGHTALRLGDAAYHYQFEPPGVLRLESEPWPEFETRYRELENRTIRVSRIPVTGETFELVEDELVRRRVTQEMQRGCAAALGARARVVVAMLAARRGRPVPIAVAGAGFFFESGAATAPSSTEPALLRLRLAVAEAHGEAFVPTRLARIQETLGRLALDDVPEPPAPTAADPVAPCDDGAARWQDEAAGMMALLALRDARPLVASTLVWLDAPLTAAERRRLDATRDALAARLVELAGAGHPGWGLTLSIGLARLAAIERSLDAGRWIVLDAYPADAPSLAPTRVARRREALAALRTVAGADFARARREFEEAAPSELALAQVEATGNRLAELDGALADGRGLRLHGGPMLPARPAPLRGLETGAPTRDLAAAATRARARATRYTRALERLYAYDLVRRNCVTELFRSIEDAVARVLPPGGSFDAEMQRRFGGRVEPDGSLAFVPFWSAEAVDAHLAVAETTELPSHRREAVARLAAREGGLRVWLREGNTLTSTVYRRNPDDSLFLFFTDDVPAARPILGAANLVVALGGGVAGLATLPFDRGERLWAAVRGVVFSVPELAFVNIRKGSFLLTARAQNG